MNVNVPSAAIPMRFLRTVERLIVTVFEVKRTPISPLLIDAACEATPVAPPAPARSASVDRKPMIRLPMTVPDPTTGGPG